MRRFTVVQESLLCVVGIILVSVVLVGNDPYSWMTWFLNWQIWIHVVKKIECVLNFGFWYYVMVMKLALCHIAFSFFSQAFFRHSQALSLLCACDQPVVSILIIVCDCFVRHLLSYCALQSLFFHILWICSIMTVEFERLSCCKILDSLCCYFCCSFAFSPVLCPYPLRLSLLSLLYHFIRTAGGCVIKLPGWG